MAEPTDVIVPILQNIQAELVGHRKRFDALDTKINNVAENVVDVQDKVEDLKATITFAMGRMLQSEGAIEALREGDGDVRREIAAIKARLEALERKS